MSFTLICVNLASICWTRLSVRCLLHRAQADPKEAPVWFVMDAATAQVRYGCFLQYHCYLSVDDSGILVTFPAFSDHCSYQGIYALLLSHGFQCTSLKAHTHYTHRRPLPWGLSSNGCATRSTKRAKIHKLKRKHYFCKGQWRRTRHSYSWWSLLHLLDFALSVWIIDSIGVVGVNSASRRTMISWSSGVNVSWVCGWPQTTPGNQRFCSVERLLKLSLHFYYYCCYCSRCCHCYHYTPAGALCMSFIFRRERFKFKTLVDTDGLAM